MTLDPEILSQILDVFRVELDEHLGVFDQGLVAVEKGQEPEELARLVKEMMRHAHSLKGAARAIDCGDVEQLAHRMETLLSQCSEGGKPSEDVLARLYNATDLIRQAWRIRDEGSAEEFDLDGALMSVETAGSPSGESAGQPETPEAPQVEAVPPETEQEQPVTGEVERRQAGRRKGPEDRRKKPRRLSDALASRETIRVGVPKLDALMAQVQELLVMRIRGEQRQDELKHVRGRLWEIERDHRELSSSIARLARSTRDPEMKSLSQILQGLRERTNSVGRSTEVLVNDLASDSLRTALITGDLQEGIRKARMLPVGMLFSGFLRMVRDLAKERGKEAELVSEGNEVELDKQILEALKDPLTHLLRNALDHGLELPAQRQKNGKPAKGSIRLSASQRGNSVVVEVADDGAGIDPEALRRKAVERHLVDAESAKEMSDAEILLFIFQTGFSTSPIITDISGRGVGLDVVRQNVGALGGVVDVDSTPGAGTTFRMTLPLTVSTFRGLIIEVGGQSFTLPLSSVVRALRIAPSEIREIAGRHTVLLEDLPVPVLPLSTALELDSNAETAFSDEAISVVVLGMAERRVAFCVDSIVKEEEIIVKSMGPQLARVRNVSAATIMGDGSVLMILNVPDLIRSAQVKFPETALVASRPKTRTKATIRVLVVDDSLTTQTLERNILQTAGYRVSVAMNAEEALAILSEEEIDLVVSDIQMPGQDGFSLTRQIRRQEKTHQLPVILVTALEDDSAKARGIEAGADAYIVKRSFDQANLLETIRQLV